MPFRSRKQFIERNDLRVGQIATEEFEAVDLVVDRPARGAFELTQGSHDQVGARLGDKRSSSSTGAVVSELLDVLAKVTHRHAYCLLNLNNRTREFR